MRQRFPQKALRVSKKRPGSNDDSIRTKGALLSRQIQGPDRVSDVH